MDAKIGLLMALSSFLTLILVSLRTDYLDKTKRALAELVTHQEIGKESIRLNLVLRSNSAITIFVQEISFHFSGEKQIERFVVNRVINTQPAIINITKPLLPQTISIVAMKVKIKAKQHWHPAIFIIKGGTASTTQIEFFPSDIGLADQSKEIISEALKLLHNNTNTI